MLLAAQAGREFEGFACLTNIGICLVSGGDKFRIELVVVEIRVWEMAQIRHFPDAFTQILPLQRVASQQPLIHLRSDHALISSTLLNDILAYNQPPLRFVIDPCRAFSRISASSLKSNFFRRKVTHGSVLNSLDSCNHPADTIFVTQFFWLYQYTHSSSL